ncbi:M64 family metallopeptidase [Hymenobacter sediminicola]|uniref:T9SS type A sorting domain-containing protein n=1 Tax=Hymenobacter sediminicola TaxID=2761579 RepID=A0A7G7W409_9BACT|nr:M64 family metallopeptidase [Hymenobacter sediminicola]QNH61102.1 T9SS type A sorting domain-containing protein [Hymenobacter sediminicola]
MKTRHAFLLLLLLLAAGANAQSFPVDTLVKTGPLDRRINLVFLSDGYQASELARFRTDVDRIVATMFTQTPFREYQAYFNVFAVRVPSAQSGASHPRTAPDCTSSTLPVAVVNNYFGSSFDQGGIHRLLVPRNQSAVASVLAASFPLYDQAFIVVNSTEYGGSGGALATSSVHPSANEISIHEIGHSFSGLSDEYWAGQQYARETQNMTQQADPTLVKWAAWMGTNGIGIYPHTGNATWYKPHQNCKMQVLGVPFCSVCRQAFTETIHTLAGPLQSYSPAATTITNPSQDPTFALTLLPPNPNTLRITWRRDNTIVRRNQPQLTVPLSSLNTGTHRVVAEVTDTTALTRATNHLTQHTYTVVWTVERTVAGIRTSAAAHDYEVQVFPNPVADALQISCTLSRPLPVDIIVYDATGRRLATALRRTKLAAGTHTYQFKAAELGLKQSGQYTLVLTVDGTPISRQLIKE